MVGIAEKMFAVAVRDGPICFCGFASGVRRLASTTSLQQAEKRNPTGKNGIHTEATTKTGNFTTKALTRKCLRKNNIRSRTPISKAPSRWLRGLFHPTNPGDLG